MSRTGRQEISGARAWLLAARPRTLLAAVAPVLVGTGMAVGHGSFAAGPALAALVGAMLIQVGTNLANDYYDHVRGGDTEDRVGPVRVTQAGILPPPAVKRGMWVAFAAAMVVGAYLVAVAGWPIALLGLVSIAAGIGYTGGPFPLAYHGLGDIFVFVFFGLVAVGGTYYVQTLNFRVETLLAGAGVGALATAILVANNLRDRETDARAEKRTLAVRIGVVGSQLEYVLLMGFAFVAPILGVVAFGWSRWPMLALLAGIVALPPLRRVVSRGHEPHALRPALAGTALTTGIYGLLLAVGLAVG